MWKGLVIVGMCVLISGCAIKTLDHPTKTPQAKLTDEVECKALARQGAGDGFGLVYQMVYTDLLVKCLHGRDWQ